MDKDWTPQPFMIWSGHPNGQGLDCEWEFKIYDEFASRNEGACLTFMMNRNRHMHQSQWGFFNMYHEPESPNEGRV